MGLFQKIKTAEKSSDELPKYVDTLLENSHQSTNEQIDERFSVENMSLNRKYGIDHAVALMRDLPNENSSVIVAVVTKTLESANINVANIIDDARAKEAALQTQIKQLNDEIGALEARIAEKKDQISVSTAIQQETCKVRELLEKAEKPGAAQAPSAKAAQHTVIKEQAAAKELSPKKSDPAKVETVAKLAIEAV
jgi:cell division protein FtsB